MSDVAYDIDALEEAAERALWACSKQLRIIMNESEKYDFVQVFVNIMSGKEPYDYPDVQDSVKALEAECRRLEKALYKIEFEPSQERQRQIARDALKFHAPSAPTHPKSD